MGMCAGYNPFYRINRSQHIRNMCYRNQFGTRSKQLFQRIFHQFSTIIDRNHPNHNAGALCLQLPGNNIAVMFHLRNNDLVTRFHLASHKAGSHQIDTLCRSTGENNFTGRTGIDETTYRLACSFMQLCSLLRQEMHSAMYIGIHGIIFIHNGIHHTTWLLGRSPVVQIHQGLAVYIPGKDRKVFPDTGYIILHGNGFFLSHDLSISKLLT